MSKLSEDLAVYRREAEHLKEIKKKVSDEIVKAVKATKENGFVKKIPSTTTIFTISSKNLSSVSWDPSYYNNSALAEVLVTKIEGMDDIEKIIDLLKSVVENKQFEDVRSKVRVRYRCNDNFVESIEKIVNSLS